MMTTTHIVGATHNGTRFTGLSYAAKAPHRNECIGPDGDVAAPQDKVRAAQAAAPKDPVAK